MPNDDPPAPPRPPHLLLVDRDAIELRETLDLLGTLVASMSDRLEGQAQILDKLTKTAAETRAAAFHAKSQMDMKPVADALAQSIEKTITPLSRELLGLKHEIHGDRKAIKSDIDSLLSRTRAVIAARDRQIAGLQARNWIPFAALGALVLVLATAALAPLAISSVSGELACRMMDGFWLPGTEGCAL